MAEKSWLKKIGLLKKLLDKTGALWEGTKLAGFDNKGPYHCANCEYLKGDTCIHPVMIADKETEKNDKGLPIIQDPEHQCCEFVSPPKVTEK